MMIEKTFEMRLIILFYFLYYYSLFFVSYFQSNNDDNNRDNTIIAVLQLKVRASFITVDASTVPSPTGQPAHYYHHTIVTHK